MNFMCAKCLEDPINGAYRTSSESYLIIASRSTILRANTDRYNT